MSTANFMKRHIRLLLAGLVLVAPFALTIYIIIWFGSGLSGLARRVIGDQPLPNFWGLEDYVLGAAAFVAVLALLWLAGALTHWWVFRGVIGALERMFRSLPVIKSIYESVRDILKFFGEDPANMGKAVRVRIPGTQVKLLGIRTARNPRGSDGGRVAVYLPASYMLGGFTAYFPPEDVEEIDLAVQEVLRLSAIAQAGADNPPAGPAAPSKQP